MVNCTVSSSLNFCLFTSWIKPIFFHPDPLPTNSNVWHFYGKEGRRRTTTEVKRKRKVLRSFLHKKTQVICNSLSSRVLWCKFYGAPRGSRAHALVRTSVITINTTASRQLSDVFLKEIKLLSQFQFMKAHQRMKPFWKLPSTLTNKYLYYSD